MFDVKLTKEQESLLREQVIDQNQPGTILRDTAMVLDFIGPAGRKSTGKYNLLPIDAIPELDSRLSRPLRLPLERPQLRSHPYLQGIHLVLRASGLLQVVGSGEKTQLLVPEDVRERWRQLNPTEQYFALLEAWLLFGRSEMIGERENRFGSCVWECLLAWRTLPVEGVNANPKRPISGMFGFYRSQYSLALMDLFGLVRIEQAPTPVHPWSPARVEHTPFGDAVFTVLATKVIGDRFEVEEDAAFDFGQWQPIFKPYFPQWQTNWNTSNGEFREGTYIFRLSLGKSSWRQIAIDAQDTLDDLIDCVLSSIKFDHDHLYEFSYRDRFGAMVRALGPMSEGELGTHEVQIGELPLELGQSMSLLYDFGDNWRFTIKLERIDPPSKRRMKPKVVESHGKAPEQYPDWS